MEFQSENKFYTKQIRKKQALYINSKLGVIDIFQFLSSSLDRLVKNLNKNDFKYLCQEFDNNVLDLVKQKGFYPCKYMNEKFEKFEIVQFKEELPSKEKLYSSLTDRKITDKEHE